MTEDIITVHVVEDDDALRRSLAVLLGSYGFVVETYASGPEFLDRTSNARTSAVGQACVLLDLRMPEMDGVGVQQAMAARGDRLPVVAVSGEADVALAVRAMKAGAFDLIEKPYDETTLMRAISGAIAGMMNRAALAGARDVARARLETLTARERDVFGSIVRGRPNKVIAHLLGISPRTVEIHRSKLMMKLECRSIADVVRLGLEAGPVDD